ncbi:MAG TPA: hypothetical protein VFP61_10255 [Acidimicrobiales bacterium]|nr:hypothetical protein [Acidimicrobiales bacterium]
MTASVQLSNLAYLIGAVVIAVVISSVLVLRQRKPRSMEANVESFNRGLRALAPAPTPPAAPDRRARRSARRSTNEAGRAG